MKTSTSPIKNLRAALVLIVMLMTTLTASATDFITDVMVVGNKNQTDFNSLINSLVSAGWTDINYDLNSGSGSGTDYIHLLFKKQSSSGNTGTPITDFYIRTGNNPPSSLTHEGRTYYLVPYDGSTSFINSQGNLNNNAGGAYIHLYYTKDALTNNHGVTGISFNTSQSGAVGENGGSTGYDLNSGAGGAYIYMHLATTSGGNVVTLTSGSGNVQLLNGHILTGTGGADTQVSVTDGATVTFNGVNLTAITNNSSHSWPGIHCLGNATIVLNGGTTNSVQGGFRSPGIYVAANKTLTIQGNGTLTATGRDYAAGIGSGQSQSSCGNITISGGTVTAAGGQNATGIGSGAEQQSCGNITISGGTVNATGLTYAAGIGSGYENASCGAITISGGTVTAAGGLYAAAIGSGYQSSCGTITITNGVTCVTATKHNNSAYSVGAGNNGSSVTVTVGGVQTGSIQMSPFVTYPYTVHFDPNGGTGTMANQSFMYNVSQNLTGNAFSNTGRGFMGWATTATGPKVYNDGQSVSNLTQNAGSTVTLYAKWTKTVTLSTDIGEVLLQDGDTLTGTGGSNTRVKIADGATVTFSGVNNTAISYDSNHQWPGIHCLGNATIVLKGGTTNSVKGGYCSSGIYVAANKTLTIQGNGTLNATGSARASGIGSSEEQSCGNITISGGTVNATGLAYAAGIGSSSQSTCGDITISGGTVNAIGGYGAAAIGSGNDHASCGDITITRGVTRVTATKDSNNNTIGAGNNGSTCGTVTIGGVTGFITMSPFDTYPYTVHFDANGGAGTMTNQALMNDVAQNLMANAFTKADWVFQGWATSATGPKIYNNGQSVSHLTDTPGATVTLYANWMIDPNHFSVNGDTCTIHSPTGWDVFCDLLAENDNGYFTGKTVKLDDDISVTTMAGSSGHEFSGTFDGQSHTLNVTYQNTDGTAPTAPFSYVNSATIQDLIVAGSITGTANRAAGIVGETGDSLSHITNCVSSVNVSGGDYIGGISVGGKVEITGCVFNGMITGTDKSGGFVGYSDNALVISNSLFAPQVGSNIYGGTFYYDGGESTPVIVNSYYTTPRNTPQGKQAHSLVGGEHVTVAFNGEATAYNTSGISAYSVGIVYGSTLYAGDGETVSLNLSCTLPTGYVLSGYTINNGLLIGEANPYTLVIGNSLGEVIIEAVLLPAITYIDGDGKTHSHVGYTVLTGNETTLEAGWYVVDDNITYDSTLTLAGDVTLILCNGKTMTVTTDSGNSINGFINWTSGFALTVYGQTLDSVAAGTLDVTNNDDNNYAFELITYTQHSGNVVVSDSHNVAIFVWDFTINGGTVNATSTSDNGIIGDDVTINGGTVNATSTFGNCISGNVIINGGTVNVSTNKGFGIEYYHNVTINGGTVNATHGRGIGANNVTINGGTVNATHGRGIEAYHNVTINGGTVTANEIYSPTTTLGWSNLTDCITVGSFDHWSTFTVSVKSGQAFYYQNGGETVIISGTLNSDQINAIGEKTLRPLTPVSYVDGGGETHTCGDYTVLTGNETMLEEGWYVVDHDISYNNTLTLAGDVNLILCNGKTMTVTTNSGNSINGFINWDSKITLTVYGQTLNSDAAGILYVFNDVGNKAAIYLSTYTQHSGNVVVNDSNDEAISAGDDITLNGGTVNATSTRRPGIITSNVIINGGTVNANGYDKGIIALNNVIINGGTVNAIGDFNGIDTYYLTINGGTVNATSNISHGIYAQFDIILGWTNPDDHILVSSYHVSEGTVSVKSGQKFYYDEDSGETVIVSGTLDETQIEAIGGKTLIPSIPYIDENGVQQYCTSYTVVTNDLEFDDLSAGWYVVSDSITLDRQIHFSGDAHLILCDGATMNISVNFIEALLADGNLTLYGQSEGTGSLTVTSTDNNGWVSSIAADHLTINGSTVTATGSGYGIFTYYKVTINGGTVNANGNQRGIKAWGDIILGWTNADDYILVSSYETSGTLSVKSGQAFYYSGAGSWNKYDMVVISDTLQEWWQIDAIGGKKLRPYIEPCATPIQLEVTDISAHTATLHWIGGAGQYEVMYEALGEKATKKESIDYHHSHVIRGLTPNTTYEWKVRGVNCDGNNGVTDWSDPITFTTEELTTVTQSIALVEGWNWVSFYVETETGDPVDLLDMLKAALGENGLNIESAEYATEFDGEEWFGYLDDEGIYTEEMYLIQVSNDCTIVLEGSPVDPGDHEITIEPGYNWIGFPCAEETEIAVALADFEAEEGDQIEGAEGMTEYDGEDWFGYIEILVPGQGYLYYSASNETKTLVFRSGAKAKVKKEKE